MPATFDPASGTLTFEQGVDDTDAGVLLQVAGEDFPRVHITPQGEVLVGDGTEAPTTAAVTDSTNADAIEALDDRITAAADITPADETPTISDPFDDAEVAAAIGALAATVNEIIAALGA